MSKSCKGVSFFVVDVDDDSIGLSDKLCVRSVPACVVRTSLDGRWVESRLDDLDTHFTSPTTGASRGGGGASAGAVDGAGAVADTTFTNCDYSLRENVRVSIDDVWLMRKYRDVYTDLSRAKTVGDTEVDHVMECQVTNVAWCTARGHMPVALRTRSQEAVQAAVNTLGNLNVTTRSINQSKKGPFMRFVRLMNTDTTSSERVSIGDLARDSSSAPGVRKLVDDGHWARIEVAVQKAYTQMLEDLYDAREADPLSLRGIEYFVDSLASLVERMKLDC